MKMPVFILFIIIFKYINQSCYYLEWNHLMSQDCLSPLRGFFIEINDLTQQWIMRKRSKSAIIVSRIGSHFFIVNAPRFWCQLVLTIPYSTYRDKHSSQQYRLFCLYFRFLWLQSHYTLSFDVKPKST